MSALLPAVALAAFVLGAGWRAARRSALAVGALVVAAWGVAGLAGAGAFRLAAGAGVPALAFSPLGMNGLWLVLLGTLGLAVALLLGSPAGRGQGRTDGPSGGPATPSLIHITLLAAALVVAARTPFSLLTAWEAMSALTFVLFSAARPGRRVHGAAALLLVVSEVGAAALYVLALLFQGGGDARLAVLAPGLRIVVALLAVVAFGTKAGLVPFQLWLPVVEPEAPGPVAGFLSGALTAVAFAALLRVLGWVDANAAVVGVALGALGLAGLSVGSLGAIFAGDTKRVLAYGTIEALGAAFLALGLGLVLRALDAPAQAATAIVGACLLVLAHSGGKLCLFALAGEIEDSGGGRRLDALGGLMPRLRWGGAYALVGALGLAGVPPLGTFVGEWLLLESLFMPIAHWSGLHVGLELVGAAVAVLSAVGLTAYLRWYGIIFLGPPRTARAERVAERPGWPRLGYGVSLLPLVLGGIATPWLVPFLQQAYAHGPAVILPLFAHPGLNPTLAGVGAVVGRGVLRGAPGVVLTPDNAFAIVSPWDLAAIALIVGATAYLLVRLLAPGMSRPPRRTPPWTGGRPGYTAAMTYTGESLTHPLRLSLAAWAGLRVERSGGLADASPKRYRARYRERLRRHGYDVVARGASRLVACVHAVLNGSVSQYVLLILAALVVAVVASSYVH